MRSTQAPQCPACGGRMHNRPIENATSRYREGVYICSDCGILEAFRGHWWNDRAPFPASAIELQHDWLKAWEHEEAQATK